MFDGDVENVLRTLKMTTRRACKVRRSVVPDGPNTPVTNDKGRTTLMRYVTTA